MFRLTVAAPTYKSIKQAPPRHLSLSTLFFFRTPHPPLLKKHQISWIHLPTASISSSPLPSLPLSFLTSRVSPGPTPPHPSPTSTSLEYSFPPSLQGKAEHNTGNDVKTHPVPPIQEEASIGSNRGRRRRSAAHVATPSCKGPTGVADFDQEGSLRRRSQPGSFGPGARGQSRSNPSEHRSLEQQPRGAHCRHGRSKRSEGRGKEERRKMEIDVKGPSWCTGVCASGKFSQATQVTDHTNHRSLPTPFHQA